MSLVKIPRISILTLFLDFLFPLSSIASTFSFKMSAILFASLLSIYSPRTLFFKKKITIKQNNYNITHALYRIEYALAFI